MKKNSYLDFWQQCSHRNLWQYPVWAQFQESIGRKTWLLESDGASALVVRHGLPHGFNWLEVPRGPLWSSDAKGLSKILSKIKEIGKKEKSVFVRFSPYGEYRISNIEYRISKYDHHPETSLVIDLTQDNEEILRKMKQKGRYNIKIAQKHDVLIENSDDVDAFYKLLKKTSHRDGFGMHPKHFYEKFFDELEDHSQLLLALYKGEVVAGGLFVYLDEWGIYYYGASDHQKRHLMAPYLLQWQAMKEAKKRGCKYYDFLGIAPENIKKHSWAGVTGFKKKFGGEVVTYPQAKEMVLRPFWYFLYRLYKKLR